MTEEKKALGLMNMEMWIFLMAYQNARGDLAIRFYERECF